jgi:hypothetical protein
MVTAEPNRTAPASEWRDRARGSSRDAAAHRVDEARAREAVYGRRFDRSSRHSLRLSGVVQDLACVLRVLGAHQDVVRPTVPSPSPAPAPLFVSRGRHSMPALRKTEQSRSASASLPATSTTAQS